MVIISAVSHYCIEILTLAYTHTHIQNTHSNLSEGHSICSEVLGCTSFQREREDEIGKGGFLFQARAKSKNLAFFVANHGKMSGFHIRFRTYWLKRGPLALPLLAGFFLKLWQRNIQRPLTIQCIWKETQALARQVIFHSLQYWLRWIVEQHLQ